MASTDPTLNERILALPQELQDAIIELMLIASLPGKSEPITVDRKYRPPWQISFNRRTRKALSEVFYSTRVFENPEMVFGNSAFILRAWSMSLTPEHLQLINTIHCSLEEGMMVPMGYFDFQATGTILQYTYGRFLAAIGPEAFRLRDGVLWAHVTMPRGRSGYEKVLLSAKEIREWSQKYA